MTFNDALYVPWNLYGEQRPAYLLVSTEGVTLMAEDAMRHQLAESGEEWARCVDLYLMKPDGNRAAIDFSIECISPEENRWRATAVHGTTGRPIIGSDGRHVVIEYTKQTAISEK